MNGAAHSLLPTLPRQRGTQLVFSSHRNPGQRMRDHKVGFLKAVRLANIPHIRFHDLRHTFATRLVRDRHRCGKILKIAGARSSVG